MTTTNTYEKELSQKANREPYETASFIQYYGQANPKITRETRRLVLRCVSNIYRAHLRKAKPEDL